MRWKYTLHIYSIYCIYIYRNKYKHALWKVHGEAVRNAAFLIPSGSSWPMKLDANRRVVLTCFKRYTGKHCKTAFLIPSGSSWPMRLDVNRRVVLSIMSELEHTAPLLLAFTANVWSVQCRSLRLFLLMLNFDTINFDASTLRIFRRDSNNIIFSDGIQNISLQLFCVYAFMKKIAVVLIIKHIIIAIVVRSANIVVTKTALLLLMMWIII